MPLLWLIRLYQLTISPLLGPCCRFTPTCSRYAVQALQVHGLRRGVCLAVWRILRCQPWSRGGYDPVPPPGKWRNDCAGRENLNASPPCKKNCCKKE